MILKYNCLSCKGNDFIFIHVRAYGYKLICSKCKEVLKTISEKEKRRISKNLIGKGKMFK